MESIKSFEVNFKEKLTKEEYKKIEKAVQDMRKMNQIVLIKNFFLIIEEVAKADELTKIEVLGLFAKKPKNSKETLKRLFKASRILGANKIKF